MTLESWPSGALAVTGLGVVSPLGWDAVSSCAAARAGLLRISPLDDYTARDPDTGSAEPVLGHTVSGCTEGFTGDGRLIRLGVAALSDLRRSQGDDGWKQTGLVLNLASGLQFQAAVASSGMEAQVEEEFDAHSLEMLRQQQERYLLTQLTRLAGTPVPSHHWRVVRGDQAGFLHALEAATRLLEQRAVSRCIIGGIDSYVDLPFIEALDELRLLKTASRPQGILPGECATFLQVEPVQDARRRGAHIHCVLGTRALHKEAHDRFAGRPWVGAALAEALSQVWRALPAGQQQVRLIGNLTGDERRAYDWGCALSRLHGHGLSSEQRAWHTGVSFGEIGAATAPMAITMAARAFARGYAGTRNMLVWLSSDNGERGALQVLAPP
jgi:3-oxoacyl-[acyl-carrier-protein] synthase-1